MNIKMAIIFSILLLVSVSLFFFSPYYSVNYVKKIMGSSSSENLLSIADVESLRCSFEVQFDFEYRETVSISRGNALSVKLEKKPIEKLIDSYTSISGLSKLALDRTIKKTGPVRFETINYSDINNLKFKNIEYDFFNDPTKFIADLNEVKFHFSFKSGSWLITDVVPPETENYRLKRNHKLCKTRVLKKIYGGQYDSKCQCIKRAVDDHDTSSFVRNEYSGYSSATEFEEKIFEIHARVLNIFSFTENGTNKYFVLTDVFQVSRDGEVSCNACIKGIGGAIFYKDGERLVEQVKTRYILFKNPYFPTRDSVLLEIGKNKYGLMIEHWNNNMGGSSGSYFLISQIDGQLRELAFFDAGSDLTGLDRQDEYNYRVHYKFFKNNADYYDIIIKTTGINEGREVNTQSRVSMSNGRYKILK